jgi:hypothetical protein
MRQKITAANKYKMMATTSELSRKPKITFLFYIYFRTNK